MNRYTATDKTLRACPLVKKKLWGGEFWTDGYLRAPWAQAWR